MHALFSVSTLRSPVLIAGLALACAASAVPHVPANGQQVVERLPSRTGPVQRELARLRAELGKSPANGSSATAATPRPG
jgi:hypothetical protein